MHPSTPQALSANDPLPAAVPETFSAQGEETPTPASSGMPTGAALYSLSFSFDESGGGSSGGSATGVGACFGKFELLSPIAAGGMGVVFRAKDRNLGRIVALKTLKNSILPDPDEVARFNREVKSAARLEHPNIIRILEFSEFRGIPYFTMDLVEGGNLASWTRTQPRSLREIVEVMEKVARAVQFAHEQGAVHRDLKPANVLMTTAGQPLLADFGLAKTEAASQDLTAPNVMLGTPPYMAPEQIRAVKGLLKSADVWALGVILYELLTGKQPFVHPQLPKLFELIQNSSPPRPRAVNPSLDAELERIILKCLEKLPEERYRSAGELADDLAAWSQSSQYRGRFMDTVRKWGRRAKRHPRAIAATLLGGFILWLGVGQIAHQMDEYKALRPAMAALERGETVTLIGETGPPKYWRELIGKAQHPEPLDPAKPLELRSMECTVLELFPGILPDCFRLEAEIQHQSGLHPGEVGLFLMYNEQIGSKTHERGFLALPFSDLPGEKPSVSRELAPCYKRLPRAVQGTLPEGSVTSRFNPAPRLPYEPQPDVWRHLALEIRDTDLLVQWDRQETRSLVLKDLENQIVASETMLAAKTPSAYSGFQPEQALKRTGPVGLYLNKAVATFRNVRLIPLRRGQGS